MSTCWWCERKSHITKVSRIHPLATMNVFTKCNPRNCFNNCWNINNILFRDSWTVVVWRLSTSTHVYNNNVSAYFNKLTDFDSSAIITWNSSFFSEKADDPMSAAITQSAAWAGQILLSFSRQPLPSCVLKPRKCLKELTQFLILWYKYTLYWWPDQALESFIGFCLFVCFFQSVWRFPSASFWLAWFSYEQLHFSMEIDIKRDLPKKSSLNEDGHLAGAAGNDSLATKTREKLR